MFLKKNIHQKIGEQFDWKSTYPKKTQESTPEHLKNNPHPTLEIPKTWKPGDSMWLFFMSQLEVTNKL